MKICSSSERILLFGKFLTHDYDFFLNFTVETDDHPSADNQSVMITAENDIVGSIKEDNEMHVNIITFRHLRQ